tara:strand:- start:18881 stop:21637 length:2757 start_codon:yes stop_codon:yes gene_type:complete
MLIFGIFLVSSSLNEKDKIDDNVYEELENEEEARVVVKLKEPNEKKGFFIKRKKSDEEINIEKQEIKENVIEEVGEENVEHVFDKTIAMGISEDELKDLKNSDNVESIILDKKVYAFLQDSVPYINASVVWPVNLSSQNITGINETICILDTGINFTHSNLVGKNKTCVIDCVGQACTEDCSVHDDNGHGTHVGGIAAASGSLNGVAIGSNLIGVKVLNSEGTGSGSDLNAGIEWCVANRVAYNISVISMSLGDCTNHSTYCNSDSSATHINNATLYNISVIVAAGNGPGISCSGITNIDGPASPACVQNATAIGTIDDSDESISFQRGELFELMAPGISINSTFTGGTCLSGCSCSGNYMSCSGTSMSAPHAAGAFALFRQFYRLQNNRVPTPTEIRTSFNSTGKRINDTSGTNLNFTIMDIHAALVDIDSSNPVVSLTSPANNTIQLTKNVTFTCSANDVRLDNITLYVWNSTGVYNSSEVSDVSGVNANLEKNITNIDYGVYEWNCLAYDENTNSSFASLNNTLTIGKVTTTLNSPTDNSFVKTNQTYNCSAETESVKLLSNLTFSIWNSTNDLVYNVSENVGGTLNSSEFNYNFTSEENYTWNCQGFNNETESDWADSNFTITYDITTPSIDAVSSSVSSTTSTININSSEITNSSVSYGTTTSLGTETTNTSLRDNHSFSLSSLSASTTYYYNITNCDRASNCITNGTNSFTTSAADDGNGGGGGGGGGGGSSVTGMTYVTSFAQTFSGYTKSLEKDDKIKFTVFDGGNVQHTLTLDHIGTDFVNLTIRSNPITISLGVGQSIKLNLSSADYYDLYIKLNSIANNKADLTIQTVSEKISAQAEITGDVIEEKDEGLEILERNLSQTFIYAIVLIFVVVGTIILLRRRGSKIKKTSTKKEYKERFKKHIRPKKK